MLASGPFGGIILQSKKIQDSSTFASHLSATLLPLEEASGWGASGASDHNGRPGSRSSQVGLLQPGLRTIAAVDSRTKKFAEKQMNGREVRYSSCRLVKLCGND